jgi:CDP-glucose 4,6-dehydratase
VEIVDVNPTTLPDPAFWRGKRVLVTGHTGFKGAWLAYWLRRMGAQVTGLALAPRGAPNLHDLLGQTSARDHHVCDIRDGRATEAVTAAARPEIVFHLAAQALVRQGYIEPLETFAVNVQGTANLLEAVRRTGGVRAVVVITTDKVYRNLEQPFPYRETDALGGHDPYSASKAAAEIIVSSYRDSFLSASSVSVASARAGNVIGGGDWSDHRLIPDAVRAWSANGPLSIRRPQAVRPWQHVLEPLAGYLRLAESLWQSPAHAGAYNFGPETHEAATVERVIRLARDAYGRGEIIWGDGSEGPHEAGWLALEITKARNDLGVRPRWPLTEGVRRTMNWYRQLAQGIRAEVLCDADIDAFEATSAD